MDAGRRGALANAHAAGLGPTRRIVVFDTLLEHFDDDAVRLVLAHELSHMRHHDRLRGLAFRAATAPLALLAAQRLLERFAPRTPVPGHPAALSAAALAMAAADALLVPARRRLFRLVEERADHDSLELSQAPRTLVEFERRIVLHNRSELDPPRWRTVLFETHPPTLRRIGAALAYESRAADAATGAAAPVSPPAPAAPRSTGT
jgi:STE24 endopeptidase